MEIVNPESADLVDGVSIRSNQGFERDLFFEQKLDNVEMAAVLGSHRKVVFNKRIDRPPGGEKIPIFEVFSRDDPLELKNLGVTSFADQLSIQRLLAYLRNSESNFESQKAVISEPLNQRLKALGYMR